MENWDDVEEVRRQREEEAEFDSTSSYEEIQERIKKEARRIKRQFSKIDKKRKALVETTIQDVAFMTITMEDLREKINREGTKVEYKNGENQYGTKQNPDVQIYLQLSQRQTQAMRILLDCVPKSEKIEIKNDDFAQHLTFRSN